MANCRPILSRRALQVGSLLLFTTAGVMADSPSWTGWRGENRDAQVQQFLPPKVWPEKLERVWSAEVGSGYATPLVVGDRIFQHARQGGEEVLLCLDLATGKTLWKQGTAVEFEAGRGGDEHGLGPKSTPTVADGRVFTLSITGVLSAWSAEDGKPLWTRDFSERFEVAHPYWGTATSPIIDGKRLFAHTGSCENGALFCLDPETGKDLWVRDEEANCYSSPLVETIAGVRQLVAFNHAGLCGIDVSNGKLLWKHPFPHHGNRQNTPTPVRHGDLIVVGAEHRGMFGVKPQKVDDQWSVKEVWRHRDASLDMSSPVVNDGLVYGFSHFKTGQLYCLDPITGEVVWEGEPRAGDNAQFLSIPGHVLALTDDGQLRVLRANRKACEIIKTYRLAEGDTWTAPALVGEALLIKAGDQLVRWKMPSGQPAEVAK